MDLDPDAVAEHSAVGLDPPREERANPLALRARDATGAPVQQQAVTIHRSEVASRHNDVGREVQPQAERLQHAAADARIGRGRFVPEQRQMARAAARGDAGSRRHQAAQRRPRGQTVEVRGPGLLQRRPRLVGRPQVANAVEHQQDDPAIVPLRQASQQRHPRHGGTPQATK